ncbi:MAG: hypothetical protein R2939_19920 [Kofleriaceae bacterium]
MSHDLPPTDRDPDGVVDPDDDADGVVDPDDDVDASEAAAAARFAELLAQTADGRLPPAMTAEERGLLEQAVEIRAGASEAARARLALTPARGRAVVDRALRAAVGEVEAPADALAARRERRSARAVGLAAVAVATAAIAVLAIRAGGTRRPVPEAPEAATATAPLPTAWRARSADPLVGRIEPAASGEAAARLDVIFADRLAGFRDRRLTPGGAR